MRAVNVPMRGVLAFPVAQPLTDRLMPLYLTGRNTGRDYRHPVSYVSEGDALVRPRRRSDRAVARDHHPGQPDRRTVRRCRHGTRRGLDRQRLETTLRHGFRIIRWRIEAGEASIVLSRKVDRS
jgi:hypothetical protein